MTPDPRSGTSHPFLILAGRIAIACLWALLLWLSLSTNGGRLAFEEGRTNGESAAIWNWMMCVLAAMLVGSAFLVLVILRAVWSGWLERFALFISVLFIFVFLILFAGPDHDTAYVAGLKQWASGVHPEQVRNWETTLGLGGATATPPPPWWYVRDPDLPYGIRVPPLSARALFAGPLPDEVRVFPATGRVIFGWGFSGSHSRVVVIPGDGESGPPAEFRTELVRWVLLSDNVWMGIQQRP